MLVLSRKPGERLAIGDQIHVEILGVHGNRVRLGIQAPPGVSVLREELHSTGFLSGDGTVFTLEYTEQP